MARKEITIDIQDREQLLTFKIREMPATKLENWLLRVALLLTKSGAQVPDGADLPAAGAYLAGNGLSVLGHLEPEKVQPLLDELLGCCSRVVERVEERCTPESVDAYILDVKTLFTLRAEAATLNLGFLRPEGESLSGFLGKLGIATR